MEIRIQNTITGDIEHISNNDGYDAGFIARETAHRMGWEDNYKIIY